MSRYEYGFGQWFVPGWRDGWKAPVSDVTFDRRLDTTKVSSTAAAPWGDPQSAVVADDRLSLPRQLRRHSQGHRWMQAAHPSKRMSMKVDSPNGHYVASVPVPLSGSFAVEGNPRPLWTMSSHIYDRHIVLVGEDGTSTEMIGCFNLFGWRCRQLARWSAEGELLFSEDRPVVAGRSSMSEKMLDRFDSPHRLALTVRGSDLDDPHFPWLGTWLALDPAKAPTPRTVEQEWLINMLVEYGATVEDHGGRTGLSWAEGGQWSGSSLHELDIRLSDFRVAQ